MDIPHLHEFDAHIYHNMDILQFDVHIYVKCIVATKKLWFGQMILMNMEVFSMKESHDLDCKNKDIPQFDDFESHICPTNFSPQVATFDLNH